MRLFQNIKYCIKYNTLKIEKESHEKILLKEIDNKIIQINELIETINELKKKNSDLRRKISKMNEIQKTNKNGHLRRNNVKSTN